MWRTSHFSSERKSGQIKPSIIGDAYAYMRTVDVHIKCWFFVCLFAFKAIYEIFLTFYWSIIALQWCVSFCFITKWISYTYTYDPISLPYEICFAWLDMCWMIRKLTYNSRISFLNKMTSLRFLQKLFNDLLNWESWVFKFKLGKCRFQKGKSDQKG